MKNIKLYKSGKYNDARLHYFGPLNFGGYNDLTGERSDTILAGIDQNNFIREESDTHPSICIQEWLKSDAFYSLKSLPNKLIKSSSPKRILPISPPPSAST